MEIRRPAWLTPRRWRAYPDWGCLLLLLVALLMAPIFRTRAGVPSSVFVWCALYLFPNDPYAPYRAALNDLADNPQTTEVPLPALDPKAAAIDLVTFTLPTPPPLPSRGFNIWATTREKLHAACLGAYNPLLRLKQVLGLPPSSTFSVVTAISVKPADLRRPCFSGLDISNARCVADLPKPPADTADLATWKQAYDTLRFPAEQLWRTARPGLHGLPPSGNVLDNAFPYTGMGWTYNWSPDSTTHIGVPEFVITQDRPLTSVGKTQTPADFCAPLPTDP